MAETFNKLKIEINQPVTDIITAVQDDTNSRYLDVFLYDNGTPIDLTGHEVRIFVEKPATNGEQFTVWNNGEITDATAGRCQFLLTTQMLAEMGYLNVQISIWLDNTEILSTEVFHIFVTESLRSDGSIESSNEYGALVVLFQNLYESIDLMTEMVQNFGIAGDVAQQIPVTTFWEMLEALYEMNERVAGNSEVSATELIGQTDDQGGSADSGTVMAKLNVVIANLLGGQQTFTQSGTFTVPSGITTIKVTACAGGGGGGAGAVVGTDWFAPTTTSTSVNNSIRNNYGASGGGGGGGAAVVDQSYSVTPGQTISITVGTGGTGGTAAGVAATNGGNTVLSGLITLAGGKAGTNATLSYAPGEGATTRTAGARGTAGGGGGGAGAAGRLSSSTSASNSAASGGVKGTGGNGGGNMWSGSNGEAWQYCYGGGGGGSYGNGAQGTSGNSIEYNAQQGGGGGGGGAYFKLHNPNDGTPKYWTTKTSNGGKGGNGFVTITWGV